MRLVFNPFTGTFDWVNDGGGGSGQSWQVDTPVETPNGIITDFTTHYTFIDPDVIVFLNGVRESHFTLPDSTTISFIDPPLATDEISFFLRKA